MSVRLTVATSFSIHPPRGGGQRRIVGLYGALGVSGVQTEVVALVGPDERPGRVQVAPGLVEVRVPRSAAHEAEEAQLTAEAGMPITDIALALLHELTPAYGAALTASATRADAVVASHPFGWPALEQAAPGLPVIYEAHNVEADLKASMLGPGDAVAPMRQAVLDVERAACDAATLVLACSTGDAQRLTELYGVDAGAVVVVPNGVSCADVRFTPFAERRRLQLRLGVRRRRTALFLGSWHGPNIDAARVVCAAATDRPDWAIKLVGGAGLAVASEGEPPGNVDVCGIVDDRFLDSVLRVVDVSLNPMASGSGTNLKMLETAAAGVPLAASATGARGLGLRCGEHYCAAEPGELPAALDALAAEDPDTTGARAEAAAAHVRATFDWPVIASAWLAHPRMQELVA